MTRILSDVSDLIDARIHDFKEQQESFYEENVVWKTGDSMLGPLTVMDPKNPGEATNKRFVEAFLTKTPISFTCSSIAVDKQTFFSPRFNIPFDACIVSIVFDTFSVKERKHSHKTGDDVVKLMVKGDVQRFELRKNSIEHSVKFDFKEPIRVIHDTSHTFFSDGKFSGSLTIWFRPCPEELN